MNYERAKSDLNYILTKQKSVSVEKLNQLLSDLNFSLESSESKEVRYLKGEIKNLHKRIARLKDK